MSVDKKYLLIFAAIGVASAAIAAILFIYQGSIAMVNSNDNFVLKKVELAHKGLVRHDHMRLGLVKDGKQIKVPANIGISEKLWHDHSLDQYAAGIAPIHTHDESGTLHIESTVRREFTFGEFLDIWGLDRSKIVKVFDLDGNKIDDFDHFVLVQDAILIMEVTD